MKRILTLIIEIDESHNNTTVEVVNGTEVTNVFSGFSAETALGELGTVLDSEAIFAARTGAS